MVEVKVNGKPNSDRVRYISGATSDIDRELDIRTIKILDQIKNKISSFNPSNSRENNTVNSELADLVNLVQQVQDYKIPHNIESLEIATELLLKSQDVEAFKIISKNLHKRLQKYQTCFSKIIYFFRVILRSWSAPNKLIFGLLFALYVTYLPILFCLMWLIELMSGLNTGMLILAGMGDSIINSIGFILIHPQLLPINFCNYQQHLRFS